MSQLGEANQLLNYFSVTREVKLPTQPLPPTPAQQQQQQQSKTNNLDVLAQTLKLSDLDFDFEPDSVGPALIPPAETQVEILQ